MPFKSGKLLKTLLNLFFICFIFPLSVNATEVAGLVKELREIFYTTQGTGKLVGYSQEFAFIEIEEGAFKSGDIVVIRSDNVVPALEELAFGEVEEVKGKMARIYITNRIKPLKAGAKVMGLKRIYVNIKIDDDNPYLKKLFSMEKDIQLQENRDEKTNVVLTFTKKTEGIYSYKAVAPSGRILLLGTLSLGGQSVFEPVETIAPVMKICYDNERGEIWILKNNELFCHTCTSFKNVIVGTGLNILRLYSENKKIYLHTEKSKTIVVDNDNINTYSGFIIQGGDGIYYPEEGKIYDIRREKVIKELPEKYEYIYLQKGDVVIAKKGDKLILITNDKRREINITEGDIIRLKNDKIYVYREQKEEVPLAGAYETLYFEFYDAKTLTLEKRENIKEKVVDFDVDEKTGEFIVLKPDGTVKRLLIQSKERF